MNTSDFTPKQIQAIRIAVAEVAGWKWFYMLGGKTRMMDRTGFFNGRQHEVCEEPITIWDVGCPNYPADLNAVMEVVRSERHKDPLFSFGYMQSLETVVYPESKDGAFRSRLASLAGFELITATATDHCIALLQVKAPDKLEEIKANP